jgi:hypothetical protein
MYDITINRNWLWKNPCWLPTQSCYTGPHWGAKDQLELKTGIRVLVENNVLDYEWSDTEPGYSGIDINPGNFGNFAGSYVDDALFTNNLFRHSYSALRMAGFDGYDANWIYQTMGVGGHRIVFANNVFDDMGSLTWGWQSPTFEIYDSDGLIDAQIYHNTIVTSGNTLDDTMGLGNPPLFSGCDFSDNIINYGLYGIEGAGPFGKAALDAACVDYKWGNTALVGGTNGVTYPVGNLTPTDWTNSSGSVRFVNYNGGNAGDYRLCTGVNTPASPCPGASLLHNAASDGTDVGANVSAVLAAVAGVTSDLAPIMCCRQGP